MMTMTRKERGKERESLQFNYIYFYKTFNKIIRLLTRREKFYLAIE